MAKRSRIEVIYSILEIIRGNKNSIKLTPLLRKSGLSSSRFMEYFRELLEKGFITEDIDKKGNKFYSLGEKGTRYLEKYHIIRNFIEDFDL